MNHRSFSVILLPTSQCNVACDYCFERKDSHRLSLEVVPVLTKRLVDHMVREDIAECEIFWQGGEAFLMGPGWYAEVRTIMERAANEHGRRFVHSMQTNLIGYSATWNDLIFDMFAGSLGTSMDFPNRHRKMFNGSAESYTDTWRKRLDEAREAGIHIGVIAVLHQGSLEAGAEAFYHYFTHELGLNDFQVNTPFPGGPANESSSGFQLDPQQLSGFMGELFDLWIADGLDQGVGLGPFDALIDHFTGRPARLPCIWKENCSNQFIAVDSKGTVAQCDCWVTSEPDYHFGNLFLQPDLTRMLGQSPARRKFVERPGKLVAEEACIECRFLSICHGGCPVRTHAALGSIDAKDPYCEVYMTVFSRAEHHVQMLRNRPRSPEIHHPAKEPITPN